MHGVNLLLKSIRSGHRTVIVVTNEVGGGVVPAYPLGRRFRDIVGFANARVAATAAAVVLCTAGLPQTLKGTLPEVNLK